MDEKRKNTRSGAAVVNEGAAQSVLRRGVARELTPEEEKVMRLRLGASPPLTTTLDWTEEELSEDLQIELQAMQIEAWMKWKAHLAAQRARQPATVPAVPARPSGTAPRPSRVKEKIIRALRRKP
jgi:transposase